MWRGPGPWTLCAYDFGVHFEIDLDGFNQRHQPAHQFLMDGMRAVGIERSLVGELHHASQFVALAARRNVHSDRGFDQAWNLSLQLPNFCHDALFLLVRDSRLPAKGEHVDVHGSAETLGEIVTARERLYLHAIRRAWMAGRPERTVRRDPRLYDRSMSMPARLHSAARGMSPAQRYRHPGCDWADWTGWWPAPSIAPMSVPKLKAVDEPSSPIRGQHKPARFWPLVPTW